MALNIDAIRSLDASKTYYLANSTGQIKEAGAWPRFKCLFVGNDCMLDENVDAVDVEFTLN